MNKISLSVRAMSLAALAAIAAGCGEKGSATETVTSALSGLQNFAFEDIHGIVWLDQGGTLGSTGFALADLGTPPSFITVGGTMFLGYHGQNNNWLHNHFWFDQVGMNPIDSGGEMYEYTTPSLTALANGAIAIAFMGSNAHLWIGLNGPYSGVDTLAVMADTTSPVIAGLPNGQLAMAFHGVNGHLWVGLKGPKSGKDTGGLMASGTDPSIAALSNSTVAYAFQGWNGHLWVGQGDGFGGSDTGVPIQGNPSVTIDVTTGRPQVLYASAPNGNIGNWNCDASGHCSGVALGGTARGNPKWVYSDNGSWEIYYCGGNANLWIGSSSLGNADQGVTCGD